MELEKLSIRRPGEPQPHWVVAHIVYDDGPIVAVLWWDDEPYPEHPLDGDGVMDMDAVEISEPGWFYWLVGDAAPAADDPRRLAANVVSLSDEGSPAEAVSALGQVLKERDPPAGNWPFGYEESRQAVREQLWGVKD